MSDTTETTEPEVLTSVNTDGVAEITLNRPQRMNAFTWRMGRLLNEALERFDADDDVRAIIVTGKGRAFCAGADLGRGGKISHWQFGPPVRSSPANGFAASSGYV